MIKMSMRKTDCSYMKALCGKLLIKKLSPVCRVKGDHVLLSFFIYIVKIRLTHT